MKVSMEEFSHSFTLSLTAETAEDVKMLVRYGINKTKQKIYSQIVVDPTGPVTAWIELGSRKEKSNIVNFGK